jgi:hypothetical protein
VRYHRPEKLCSLPFFAVARVALETPRITGVVTGAGKGFHKIFFLFRWVANKL